MNNLESKPDTTNQEKPKKKKFTKTAFIKDRNFEKDVLILKALLDDEKSYTVDEVKDIIKAFKKGVM